MKDKPKTLRHIFCIFCLPFLLVTGLVGYELFGMAVNHSTGAKQTRKLKETLKESFTDAVILDVYEKTGHVSGNGNHVDMLSVIVFRTKQPYEDVLENLSPWNTLDEWGFDLQQLNMMQEKIKETGVAPFYYDDLQLPEDNTNCYVVFVCQSAPFVDNIEGH